MRLEIAVDVTSTLTRYTTTSSGVMASNRQENEDLTGGVTHDSDSDCSPGTSTATPSSTRVAIAPPKATSSKITIGSSRDDNCHDDPMLYQNMKAIPDRMMMESNNDAKPVSKEKKRRKVNKDGAKEVLAQKSESSRKSRKRPARATALSSSTPSNTSDIDSSRDHDDCSRNSQSREAETIQSDDTSNLLGDLLKSHRTMIHRTDHLPVSSFVPFLPQQQQQSNNQSSSTAIDLVPHHLETLIRNHPLLRGLLWNHQVSSATVIGDNAARSMGGNPFSMRPTTSLSSPQGQVSHRDVIPEHSSANDSLTILRSMMVQHQLAQYQGQQIQHQEGQQHHQLRVATNERPSQPLLPGGDDAQQGELMRRLVERIFLVSTTNQRTTSLPLVNRLQEESFRHSSPSCALSQLLFDGVQPLSPNILPASNISQPSQPQAGNPHAGLLTDSFLQSLLLPSIATELAIPREQSLHNPVNRDSARQSPMVDSTPIQFSPSQNAPPHFTNPFGLSSSQPTQSRDDYQTTQPLAGSLEEQIRYLHTTLLQNAPLAMAAGISRHSIDGVGAYQRILGQNMSPLFPGDNLVVGSTNQNHTGSSNSLASSVTNVSRSSAASIVRENKVSTVMVEEGGTMDQPQLSVPTTELGKDGFPLDLPFILALPDDSIWLSPHQVFLRQQIEVFRASKKDISTHRRGRNKPVLIGQVGIRCRHCAHISVDKVQKGSIYFPATLHGIYQAAQNMSTIHLQCGLCFQMPEAVRQKFSHLVSTKAGSSGAGRPHWERAAKNIGLVDTPNGIRFIRDEQHQSTIQEQGQVKSDNDPEGLPTILSDSKNPSPHFEDGHGIVGKVNSMRASPSELASPRSTSSSSTIDQKQT